MLPPVPDDRAGSADDPCSKRALLRPRTDLKLAPNMRSPLGPTLDGEYVAKGLEYAYYTRLRGANGIRVYSHVFHVWGR